MQRFFLTAVFLTASFLTGCGWLTGGASSDTPGAGQAELVQYADANTALNEGTRFLDEGNIERAIDALNQAVAMNPDLAEAFFKLGVAYRLAEMRDELEGVNPTGSETEEGDLAKPKKPNSRIAFEKAVEAYRKLIEANPDDHAARFTLGRALGKLDRDNDAARELRQAVRLNPDDTEYQTELGSILIRLAKYQEAIGALRKALEVDPANSQAEELLERAEAGRQRLDYVTVKKEEKEEEETDETESGGDSTPANTDPAAPANAAQPKPVSKPSQPAQKPML